MSNKSDKFKYEPPLEYYIMLVCSAFVPSLLIFGAVDILLQPFELNPWLIVTIPTLVVVIFSAIWIYMADILIQSRHSNRN